MKRGKGFKTLPQALTLSREGRVQRFYDYVRGIHMVRLGLAAFTVFGAIGVSISATHAIFGHAQGPAEILRGVLSASLFVAMYIAFNSVIEDRRQQEFTAPGWAAELGLGLLAGLALFSAVVSVIWAGGGYAVVGTNPASVLYPVIGISILSGVIEEIMLRGLFFRLVEAWLGSWAGLVLSALLFGAMHLGNRNATPLAAAAIALEAGVMLAALFMVTRRLWAVIGLHAAWNFAQGGIFGIAVSGNATDGLLVAKITGPEWLTGGAFGAESSLPAVVICTLFGIGVLMRARRLGRFVPPIWVRRRQGAALQA